MKYTTIYTTPSKNQVPVIRHLFEEHQIDHRIFDEPKNDSLPEGTKVQVINEQVNKAKDILKENGFYGTPEPYPDSRTISKFWIFLTLALFLVIIISIVVNLLDLL